MPRYPRNKISDVVAENLPDFVVQDHPLFVTFVEEYYKWLESQDNSYFAPMSLLGTVDIDQTTDDFLKYFKNEVFKGFPDNITSVKGDTLDLRSVLKRVRSFYLAKGTESSIRFLLRALFDVYSEVYIPSTDILNASGGRWIQPTIIRCIDSDPDRNRTLRNLRVEFIDDITLTSQGSATIVDLRQFTKDGTPILELELFAVIGSVPYPGKVSSASTEPIEFSSTLLSMVSGVTFTDGGSNYQPDDSVTVVSGAYSGKGVKASVESVDKTGSIRSIRIDDPGLNYYPFNGNLNQYVVSVVSETGTGADGLLITTSPKVTRVGYWSNNDGKVSSTEKLQDNYRYQIHSYVVKTEANLSEYKDSLKEFAHPSGKLVLGDYLVYRKESATASTGGFGIVRDEMPLFANYFPYTIAVENDFSNGVTCTDQTGVKAVLPSYYDLRGVIVDDLGGAGTLSGFLIDYFPYGYDAANSYDIQGNTRTAASALGAGISSGWDTQNFRRYGGIGATQEFLGQFDNGEYTGSTMPGWPSNNIDWWIVHPHPNTWHGGVQSKYGTGATWGEMRLQDFILGPYILTSPPVAGASYDSQGTLGSTNVPDDYGQDL